MDIKTLFGSTVIAAFLSGSIALAVSRRQETLQYITAERKEWREKIREIAYKLNGATYGNTINILTELKVRINAFGNEISFKYSDDAHIWELIKELEAGKCYGENLNRKQKQLIEYLSLLLKFDWERSKKEVRENIYEIASRMIFICSGIYFAVSIIICNKNNSISNFDLLSMVGMFVILIVLLSIVVSLEIKGTCRSVLKGVTNILPSKNTSGRVIFYYILWSISIIVLFVFFYIVIIEVYDFIGMGDRNQFSIGVLSGLYILALVLQYISQTLNVKIEYYYISAIDRIRIDAYKN